MNGANDFFGNVVSCLTRYEGQDLSLLVDNMRDYSKSKNANHNRLLFLLHKQFGDPAVSLVFNEGGAALKTVSINEQGKPKESMSLPRFSFREVANTPFEESSLYRDLSKTFVFAFFKGNGLLKIKCHRFREEELFGPIKKAYEDTARLLNEGNAIKEADFSSTKSFKTNFIGESAHLIIHIRPHARNSCDMDELPVVDRVTGYRSMPKQSFWINREYIAFIYAKEKE